MRPQETAALPFRILLSKEALRTYLSTIILAFTALTLYIFAVTAYAFFYYNYIPNINISTPIHLQFDHSTEDPYTHEPSYHPHGVSSLTSGSGPSSELVSQQKYDLSVTMSLPRTPANIDAGNFMVSLSLLGPASRVVIPPYSPTAALVPQKPNATILAISSRPTTLTYRSPAVEYAKKVLALPWYVVGWRHETEVVSVHMMDGVSFERGWKNIPTSVWVEVRSRNRLQIYSCNVNIRATLSGVRWLMYRHRITSFLGFTFLFWVIEMSTALFIWLAASYMLADAERTSKMSGVKSETPSTVRVKQEGGAEEEHADYLSDTDRTFPTYAGQPPLRYTSPHQAIVKEEGDDGSIARATGIEADISADPSDEDADFVLDEPQSMTRGAYDSGLGTSMESSAGSIRRRRSGGK